MGSCRKCGRRISGQYLFCYYCNKSSKTYKDEKGYVRFKGSDKSLHRFVAEKKLGRKLRRGEVVHHKNRHKSDNKWANLWVFGSQKEHDRTHKKDAENYGKKASYQGFKKKKKSFFSFFWD